MFIDFERKNYIWADHPNKDTIVDNKKTRAPKVDQSYFKTSDLSTEEEIEFLFDLEYSASGSFAQRSFGNTSSDSVGNPIGTR
jgi:hypothetical protein